MLSATETARRVRELAPGPETGAAVRAFIARGNGSLDDFLAGMLAALDPASALSTAVCAPAPAQAEELQEATGGGRLECSRSSDRETVLAFCRERLGLCPDGEQKSWTAKYVGTYEDRTDDGEVWIFFPRRPQADVRKRAREAGFWYRGKPTYGWCHSLGAKAERRAA